MLNFQFDIGIYRKIPHEKNSRGYKKKLDLEFLFLVEIITAYMTLFQKIYTFICDPCLFSGQNLPFMREKM